MLPLKICWTVFTAVLRTFYTESQDLAKIYLAKRNFSTLTKLAKVIFGFEGSQNNIHNDL